MKTFTAVFAALLLITLTALAGGKFPAISHDALKKAIAEKKITLIDVNGSTAYRAGHIPGALDFEVVEADFAKKLAAALEKEAVALDIGGYRDAPPGLRIWCGATVDTADIVALGPWLDWAWAQVKP